ncbi:hypothetical protein FHX39_001309 [Friedmanniella antarctica]|uniref:Uncharacterized protein n=1 Tax=Microlunatus antarcticus TaxID=53388 RepID=A0A7W5JUC3_9ACTN|nr:hypothetical protein [Microlunatus antarcticus]
MCDRRAEHASRPHCLSELGKGFGAMLTAMDENGNVRTSTLIVGVVATLALIALGTFVIEPLIPRFKFLSYLPALVFTTIYINVHRRRAAGDASEHQHRPTNHD